MIKKTKVIWIIFVIGAITAFANFFDFMLFVKKQNVNLNEASISEFDKQSLVDGEIDFVYGPFAELEETRKTRGIPTGKTITEFYLVGNFTDEMLASTLDEGKSVDAFFTVLAVTDKEMIKKLDRAAEEWIEYFTVEEAELPHYSIKLDGKAVQQHKDSDYDKYLAEAKGDLLNVFDSVDVAEYQVREGKITAPMTYALFFGGIAVCLLCAVILIVSIKKERKHDKEFDAAFNEDF